MQAQLVETALLTIINHQSLIATKTERIVHAAKGDGVMEFGLRRARELMPVLTAQELHDRRLYRYFQCTLRKDV